MKYSLVFRLVFLKRKMATEAISQLILQKINDKGSADTLQLSSECSKDHQIFVGAVKSLQALGNVSNPDQNIVAPPVLPVLLMIDRRHSET